MGYSVVNVDELESVLRFQRVPLMDVAVNKDGPFVAMRGGAPRCARYGVGDGVLRAWVIQFLPGRRDEVGEPATLLGAGRQTAARRGRHTRATVEQRTSWRLRIGSASS